MKEWRAANPGAAYAATKAWRYANPTKYAGMVKARYDREIAAEGRFTGKEWRQKCKEYDDRCAYCREAKQLTVHHVVPLSKGGSNWITNIAPACQPCNSKIGTKVVPPPQEVSNH